MYLSDELQLLAAQNKTRAAEIVKDSQSLMSTGYLTQYFNSTSMQLGFNTYVTPRWLQAGLVLSDYRQNQYVGLQQTQCSFYNNIFFDLSQFGSIFGQDCETYLIQDSTSFGYENTRVDSPIYTQVLLQSRSYLSTTWSVQSVDIVLGLIGGFVGLIWDLLGVTMGGYESFKFNTSLISEIYSTTEQKRMMKDSVPESHEAAQDDLQNGITSQARYYYHYSEYLTTRLLVKCLCCFKSCLRKRACYQRRKQRYERHSVAEEQLA